MLTFPEIDPTIFSLGPLEVRWYGLCYLLGFLGAYWICLKRMRLPKQAWTQPQVLDLLMYVALGVVVGGSLGYWLIYQPGVLLKEPWKWMMFWEPGRSFHGGMVGVLIAILIFCRQHRRSFLEVTDFVAPAAALAIGFGRIGNFINGELWGRVTNMPWGMVFPPAGFLPRHPSQLYEAALEGFLLCACLLIYGRKSRPTGNMSAYFLIGYGAFRFLAECYREPDWHLGFLALEWMTMGQILSIPMILAGFALLWYASQRRKAHQRS